MAGIYIHIPFCKKICSYCDFYKTTIISLIPEYLDAMEQELEMRSTYLGESPIETIYIGGGTPSLLKPEEISRILNKVRLLFNVTGNCEITVEANPDDLDAEYLTFLRENTTVNRLSIGLQSFTDDFLRLLNRRHSVIEGLKCIAASRDAGFNNISIDLIYGLPGLTIDEWKRTLDLIPVVEHISAYHLTIEPGTALSLKVKKGLLSLTGEEESAAQFAMLHEYANANGFLHYEISNLGKSGYLSRHNSAYWRQEKYLGIGPSAHSYDLDSRQWNTPNLKNYLKAIQNGSPYFEKEILSIDERYNEFVMLSLRTMWGLDQRILTREFGDKKAEYFVEAIRPFLNSGDINFESDIYRMTLKGWLISDYIISALLQTT